MFYLDRISIVTIRSFRRAMRYLQLVYCARGQLSAGWNTHQTINTRLFRRLGVSAFPECRVRARARTTD